jgi:hypothetical protein
MQASQLNRGEKDHQEQDNPALNKVTERNIHMITNTAREYNTRVL